MSNQERIIEAVRNDIPKRFSLQTANARAFTIQKGQINNFRLRPTIVNEHVETAREVQAVVNASTIVGQIFKASQDNINGITLTLQSAAGEDFDDFESYADSAALQAAWLASNASFLALLEQTIVSPNNDSTKSMNTPGDAVEGDEWKKSTGGGVDFTGYTGNFDFYATNTYAQSKMRVFVEDSLGNTNSAPIVQQDVNSWERKSFPIETLVADDVTPADITDIDFIGFRLEDRRINSEFYFDNLESIPEPGNLSVELWDMGETMPQGGVTSIDDGTQYTELGDIGFNGGGVVSTVNIELVGGKRQYFVRDFVAGVALEIPSNTLLNVDHYYAIVLKYVDTDVSVYGANTSFETVYYNNGYAFTAPDVSTAITKLGQYNDLQFAVFSTGDVYLNTLIKSYDDVPGNDSRESVYIENKDMHIESIIANESKPDQNLIAEFRDRTHPFPKGGKFEVNLSDDAGDNTTQVTVLIGYIFEPQEVNG